MFHAATTLKHRQCSKKGCLLLSLGMNKLNCYKSKHTDKMAVSIVAAVTIQSTTVCWTILVTFTPNIVAHPRDGTGPKLVAKRLARKVKRLLDAAGAGEVAPVNKASFWAMKSPDAA